MIELSKVVLDKFYELEGEESQLLQTSGECAELIAVIQNYIRNEGKAKKKSTIKDVMGEAVDVYFMIQQIRNLNPEMFDKIVFSKTNKVMKRLYNLLNEKHSM